MSFIPTGNFEAGIKKALEQSAVYPFEFGMAIASLIPNRGCRLPPHHFTLGSYVGDDEWGSLDDLLKGRSKAWWRNRVDF